MSIRVGQRYTLFPIQDVELWELYKMQVRSFWTADEIDFGADRSQWNDLLTDDERHFIKYVLAFFAGTDSIVALNLLENFSQEVTLLEAQFAYMFQAAMESIHSEVYSLMIDTYVKDAAEKDGLFRSMETIPCVRKKMLWAEKWSLAQPSTSEAVDRPVKATTDTAATTTGEEGGRRASFARRLVAFCIVEGLFFSGAFCAIYWIKQRNLLPALTKSNEFISRDEGMHTKFGCLMYNRLPSEERIDETEIHDLFRDAVEVEKEFITESIPCRMVGMNSDLMATYIEYVADLLLVSLQYRPLFGSRNPFPFMDLIGMSGRSNFFEERPSQYQRADAHASDALTYDEDSILNNEEF